METGRCACRSGYTGDACETRDAFPCNSPDGHAILSRCAGSCDQGAVSHSRPGAVGTV
jgi:hypothetical protein